MSDNLERETKALMDMEAAIEALREVGMPDDEIREMFEQYMDEGPPYVGGGEKKL
jgi:hypothetical protein